MRFGRVALAVVVLLCGLTLIAGYANKARCTGPDFDEWGRTQPDYKQRIDRDVCYSDIQHLWIGRDIDRHVFPYIHGRITDDGQLVGGSVEYPVVTGLLIWAGAIFASNDAQYLAYSALLMAPFGLLTAYFLGRLSRWRALAWAIGPPLVLYAFHNWDLPVVACAVAAVYVIYRGWGRAGAERPLVQRATVASVLLAVGFAFKVYPGAFVLPLLLYVLTGGRRRADGTREIAPPVRKLAAVRVVLAAVVTVVLVNLPFALFGYQGWRASFTFQQLRQVDITTNSVWFWGFRPFSDPSNTAFQDAVGFWSPTLVLASFAAACLVGWWHYQRHGVYPWIQVSAAMLCGFLLFHKVHSPQYTLWLVPFFVLLRVRWGWVIAYYLADLAMGIGIFRWYYATANGLPSSIYDGFAAQAVMIGVWGRAALLVGLFVVFLAARSTVDEDAIPSERPQPLPAG
ncbi:glycosyltransferase family 87 protein [Longimycelium tulufanense]|uniref:glycosyltransferase family 87 protein n=1 Tax=Longimycelium tulufanense TaxID=907463 RepID=UPI001662AA05